MSTIEQFNKYVMPSYGRYDLVLDSGSGRQAVDENGKEYIDFGSGIGTNSLGYCNENWVRAICDQAHKIQHTATGSRKPTNAQSRSHVSTASTSTARAEAT